MAFRIVSSLFIVMPLKTPFFLGDVKLPSNIFCAPLAGCSDLPFRQMTTRYRPGLVYCEMVKMDALVRHDLHTYKLLDYTRGMHPIGAQLCGSKPHLAKEAAKIVEDLGFDIIDFNCGCPVDKVTKDGSGSGMLKNLKLMGETLAAIVSSVKIPVTIKIRAGWDEKSLVGPQVVKIAEEAGAKAIAIHGRTREQAYKGSANWGWIKQCKEVASNILVIGNGDLFDAPSVLKMFEETGCDAVLLARGTFGAPWIIEDVYRKLEGKEAKERCGSDYKEALLSHFEAVTYYHTPRKIMMDMRRIGCWYLKQGQGTKKLRDSLNKSTSVEEMRRLIEGYAWDETQFSPAFFLQEEGEDASC